MSQVDKAYLPAAGHDGRAAQRQNHAEANHTRIFALEYEAGPWDGVEGAQYLYRQVLAAL